MSARRRLEQGGVRRYVLVLHYPSDVGQRLSDTHRWICRPVRRGANDDGLSGRVRGSVRRCVYMDQHDYTETRSATKHLTYQN